MWDRRSASLYEFDEGHWIRWTQLRRRTRMRAYMMAGDFERNVHSHWEVAVVTHTPRSPTVQYEGHAQYRRNEHSEQNEVLEIGLDSGEGGTWSAQRTLADVVQRAPPSLKWALEDITLPQDNGEAIASRIIRGRGRCVCDGSVKQQLGTAAAGFMDTEGDKRYIVRNRTPGSDHDIHSFRSEL